MQIGLICFSFTAMRFKLLIPLLFIFLSFFSCKEYTPKPSGYPRIEKSRDSTLTYLNKIFSFRYPSSAQIEDVVADKAAEKWINIHYPQYKATVYCSYITIKRENLDKALDDNYRIVYSHVAQANGINQTRFEKQANNTSGIIYDIAGNVASPIQFFLTDSTNHFFRGSLYYDDKVNADSVAPVTSFLREDIIRIMESMEWNNTSEE